MEKLTETERLASRADPALLAFVKVLVELRRAESVRTSRRALALAAIFIHFRRYRKVALNVLAVQIWRFTVPPTFI